MHDQTLFATFNFVYGHTLKNFDHLFIHTLAQYHLSFDQYQILHELAIGPRRNVTSLSLARSVTKPAVSRQIRVLCNLQYITRHPDARDHRRQSLELLPLGAQVEHDATLAIHREFHRWQQTLGTAKLQELLVLLNEFGTVLAK
ncbi:MarR family winged helix-turn-helix transcriptional regulator [Lacticaseibacillus baoqingensis]|uniref:MarR family winged helix-turn-helix transcriptional regulator n=1 Tax=Lacticaseibacillus baoqingensis TaxID=2486013 RepID=A0ABW4E6Z9_9LACO|nr:MarR family winged helix-turn-helix transcriptional regulator [Lacticaseibacillus baoqingensis]